MRYYGAYSDRFRGRVRAAREQGAASSAASAASAAQPVAGALLPDASPQRAGPEADGGCARAAWARLLARVFEVNPLLCPRCAKEMKVVALITDPAVIDRILAHRRRVGLESPFDARGPPPAPG